MKKSKPTGKLPILTTEPFTIKTSIPQWIKRKSTPTPEDPDEAMLVKEFLEYSQNDTNSKCIANFQELPEFSDSRIKSYKNPLSGKRITQYAEDTMIGTLRSYRAEVDVSVNSKEVVTILNLKKLYLGLNFFTAKRIRSVLSISIRQAQRHMEVIRLANILLESKLATQ